MCVVCERGLPDNAGARRKYCGDTCRKRAAADRLTAQRRQDQKRGRWGEVECPTCLKVFLRPGATTRFCSQRCARLAESHRVKHRAKAGRRCDNCESVLRRRRTESRKQFCKRKYCGPGCRKRHAAKRFIPRACEKCGSLMRKRMNESVAEYSQRRYCSLNHAMRARGVPPAQCRVCGAATSGPKRHFCSIGCKARSQRGGNPLARLRTCPVCGHLFDRKVSTSGHRLGTAKKTCSRSCGARLRYLQPTTADVARSPIPDGGLEWARENLLRFASARTDTPRGA